MHALALTILLALARLTGTLSLSIPPTPLRDSSSMHLQNINTTRLGAWPSAPVDYPITQNAILNITGYGRRVCHGHIDCECQIRSDLNEIGWKIIRDYEPSAQTAFSFTSGDVNFCIKQETATDSMVVLKVIHTLNDLTRQHGTIEVVGGSIVSGRGVVARLMLTFPGL